MAAVQEGGLDGAAFGAHVGFVIARGDPMGSGDEEGRGLDGSRGGAEKENGGFGRGGKDGLGGEKDVDRAREGFDGEEVVEWVGAFDGSGCGSDDGLPGVKRGDEFIVCGRLEDDRTG